MRTLVACALLTVVLLGAAVAGAAGPFAVVELFTSEGCSSCPPADRLLQGLVREAEASDTHLYALAFHVDYWNGLGWTDRFSRASYSRRQRRYARVLAGGVYTPEMVVNGRHALVGSDAPAVRRAIGQALSRPAGAGLEVSAHRGADPDRVVVTVGVSGAREGIEVAAAVVEDGLVTRVERGENGGRTLHHVRVVRAFATVPLRADGGVQLALRLPGGLDPARSSIIALAQDGRSMAVIAAAEVPLPPG